MSIEEDLDDLINRIGSFSFSNTIMENQNQTVRTNTQGRQLPSIEIKITEQLPTFTGENLLRFISHCEHIIHNYYDENQTDSIRSKSILNLICTKISDECFSKIAMFPINNWNDLKNLLNKNFGDKRDVETLMFQLINLKQNRRSCLQYYHEFLEIYSNLSLKIEENEKSFYDKLVLKHFVRNLDPQVGLHVLNQNHKSIADVYEAVQKLEDAYPDYFVYQKQQFASKRNNLKPQIKYIPIPSNVNRDNVNTNFSVQTFPARQFPTQPIPLQSREIPRKYPTNEQVFGKPQNVFAPSKRNERHFRNTHSNFQNNPTPMSGVSTIRSRSNILQNRPSTSSQIRPQGFQNHFQNAGNQPRNFISEELFETEENENLDHENLDQEIDYETENYQVLFEDEFVDESQNFPEETFQQNQT